jgi:hypothetical protein
MRTAPFDPDQTVDFLEADGQRIKLTESFGE